MFYVDWFAWILKGTQYNIVTYKFSIFVIPHKKFSIHLEYSTSE